MNEIFLAKKLINQMMNYAIKMLMTSFKSFRVKSVGKTKPTKSSHCGQLVRAHVWQIHLMCVTMWPIQSKASTMDSIDSACGFASQTEMFGTEMTIHSMKV